jgi:hypothetical protein
MIGYLYHPSAKPSQKMNGYLCHPSTKPRQKMNGYLYHPSTKPSRKMNGDLYHPSTKPHQKMNGDLYHPSTKPSQNFMDTYIIHLPSQAKIAWALISSIYPNRLKTFAWKARRVLSFEPTTGVANEVGG